MKRRLRCWPLGRGACVGVGRWVSDHLSPTPVVRRRGSRAASPPWRACARPSSPYWGLKMWPAAGFTRCAGEAGYGEELTVAGERRALARVVRPRHWWEPCSHQCPRACASEPRLRGGPESLTPRDEAAPPRVAGEKIWGRRTRECAARGWGGAGTAPPNHRGGLMNGWHLSGPSPTHAPRPSGQHLGRRFTQYFSAVKGKNNRFHFYFHFIFIFI